MKHSSTKNQLQLMFKAVISFFTKMVKAQEEYPIKYYKRGKPYGRTEQFQ